MKKDHKIKSIAINQNFSRVKKDDKKKFFVFSVCLVIVLAIGFLGSIFTDTGSWYQKIKPAIAPPNQWFGIVWSILYIMIAVSIYLRWIKSEDKKTKIKIKIILFYGINLILNFFWSVVYFGFKFPLGGMIVIILIWFSILQLIIWNWKINRNSAYLLIPYLLWVSYASLLNFLTI